MKSNAVSCDGVEDSSNESIFLIIFNAVGSGGMLMWRDMTEIERVDNRAGEQHITWHNMINTSTWHTTGAQSDV